MTRDQEPTALSDALGGLLARPQPGPTFASELECQLREVENDNRRLAHESERLRAALLAAHNRLATVASLADEGLADADRQAFSGGGYDAALSVTMQALQSIARAAKTPGQ